MGGKYGTGRKNPNKSINQPRIGLLLGNFYHFLSFNFLTGERFVFMSKTCQCVKYCADLSPAMGPKLKR